jgi:hypothetical protein
MADDRVDRIQYKRVPHLAKANAELLAEEKLEARSSKLEARLCRRVHHRMTCPQMPKLECSLQTRS